MDLDSETLAVRALNHARNVFPPAYVGLRYFVDPIRKLEPGNWLQKYVNRKLVSRKNWRFWRFNVLKAIHSNDVREHRFEVIGSPTTLLAEAQILRWLSVEPSFATASFQYSHVWPRSQYAGRSFEFFSKGYGERNSAIAKSLKQNEIAIVTDVRQFYPSLDSGRALARFGRRLENISASEQRVAIERFAGSLLDQAVSGVPIGSQLSHVIANVAIEEIDANLSNRYSGRYFRYVDDIVITGTRQNQAEILKDIANVMSKDGLSLNEDKTDVVTAADWSMGVQSITESNREPFHELMFAVALYLRRNPGRVSQLTNTFRNEGLNLPVRRWYAAVQQRRFRVFMHFLTSPRLSKIASFVRAISKSESDLVRAAKELRFDLVAELAKLTNLKFVPSGTARKWQIQKYRFLINRLLYLVHPGQYREVFRNVPKIPELDDSNLVIDSLVRNDVSDLLTAPGRPLFAFAELWSNSDLGRPNINLGVPTTAPVADALAILLLYDVIDGEEIDINEVPQRELLRFCGGRPQVVDQSLRDLGFVDELRTLQGVRKKSNVWDALNTRFAGSESVGLYALRLGGGYYDG